jgi:hypothetical protein
MKLHGNDPDLLPGSSDFKGPVVTTIAQLIPSQFLFSDYLKEQAICNKQAMCNKQAICNKPHKMDAMRKSIKY